MRGKFKFLLLFAYVILISFYASDTLKKIFLDNTDDVITTFYSFLDYSKNTIAQHIDQAEQIKILQEKNEELQERAALLMAFDYELNDLLADNNSTLFKPYAKLVRAMSYAKIGDSNKIWIDFKDYNSSKIYGLMHKGVTAGIVINDTGRPLAILQNDPKSSFVVYIGERKIPGVAKGTGKGVEIKYIAKWLEPQIGDEVYTSGLDDIFFGGISVGKITGVVDETIYLSASVQTYSNVGVPEFLYVLSK